MESPAHALTAIEKLHNKILRGRKLVVRMSTKQLDNAEYGNSSSGGHDGRHNKRSYHSSASGSSHSGNSSNSSSGTSGGSIVNTTKSVRDIEDEIRRLQSILPSPSSTKRLKVATTKKS